MSETDHYKCDNCGHVLTVAGACDWCDGDGGVALEDSDA